MTRRTPMRRQSDKRAAEYLKRRDAVAVVHSRCQGRCEARVAGCRGTHDHTHEIVPRSQGGSATDPDNMLAVCRSCHYWIHHVSPNKARELGLLRDRGPRGLERKNG